MKVYTVKASFGIHYEGHAEFLSVAFTDQNRALELRDALLSRGNGLYFWRNVSREDATVRVATFMDRREQKARHNMRGLILGNFSLTQKRPGAFYNSTALRAFDSDCYFSDDGYFLVDIVELDVVGN
jgi:hypothetical protein